MPVLQEDSLFSLELVIDKLYIPHVVCRFPAVAFRLLDFPTILISHVEPELGDKIKEKIAHDPYYTTPDQFTELQDNHGNYIVKKGKSCLFKTSVDSLKAHLANTPLYVMVLDMFPETPKLVGNSSVPLDSLMKHICADIAKKGITIPSVQGDKGLFKIYSLMGKEMGYIVLGFRLMCLGPGLVGHIPNKKIPQTNLTTEDGHKKESQVCVINVQPDATSKQTVSIVNRESRRQENGVRSSQDMGSMTDAMTHDVLLQTIPTEEKAVHVVISEPEILKPKQSSISTQTQRQRRQKQHVLLQGLDIYPEDDENDNLETPNIVCPPPLFYNKYSKPKLRTERPINYTDDESDDDLSKIGSICGRKLADDSNLTKDKKETEETPKQMDNSHGVTVHESRLKFSKHKSVKISEHMLQSEPVFPILTALLNELVGIQGAHGLENIINRVGEVTHMMPPREIKKSKHVDTNSTCVCRPTLSSESKKIQRIGVENMKSPRTKGWIRKVPESEPKTGKLTYKLTKTQKLRIAKGNPKWLLEKEKKEESLKPHQTLKEISEQEDDLNVTNFSDTLTEVRRLYEKEIENNANETLDSIVTLPSPDSSSKLRRKKTKQKGHPSDKGSPKEKQKQPSKSRLKPKQSQSSRDVQSPSSKKTFSTSKDQILKPVQSSPSVMEHDVHHPSIAMEPDLRRFVPLDQHSSMSAVSDGDSEEPISQNSVDVHLPKVSTDDASDDDISLPDNDKAGAKMMSNGLVERSNSFRDSILGKSHMSFSMSETADDNGPLESTRTSQNYRNDIVNSKVYQSTTDNDTHQFLSTEEPELKKLMSEDDSDGSIKSPRYVPTFSNINSKPSVRSSLKFPVLNPVASEQSPIPVTRKSTVKSEGRASSKTSDNASSQGSSMIPTPRARRSFAKVRESIHTESVSSYLPSDGDAGMSLTSDANYSDDFHLSGSVGSVSDLSNSPEVPRRLIPSTKLGYTIS